MRALLTLTTLLVVAAVLSATIIYAILFVKVLAFLLLGVVSYSVYKQGKEFFNKFKKGIYYEKS